MNRAVEEEPYFNVSRGYVLFSHNGGSRPSWSAAASRSCIELIVSRLLQSDAPERPMLARWILGFLTALGERFLGTGSWPRLASIVPHSTSWASIFSLIWRAWSAILLAWLPSSSVCSRNMWLRSSRFSDRSRAHSFSRLRILRDWVELVRAISLF